MDRSKYAALGRYLAERQTEDSVPMSFAQIERLVGTKLPASKRYPAWWSNNPSNNVMTKVWLAAGFKTEQVDVASEKLVFRNAAKMMREFDEIARKQGLDLSALANGVAEEPREFCGAESKPLGRHPAIGALKGTFTIEPGWDLTKPAMDPDELEEWEASLDRKADLIEQGMAGKKP